MAQHYDDETLIAILDRDGSDPVMADEHVTACETCGRSAAEFNLLMENLAQESVWSRPVPDEPRPQTVAFLRQAAADFRREDAGAEDLFAELTGGDRGQWIVRLETDPRYRTAAMVRRLGRAADEIMGKSPADELAFTDLAIRIAQDLDPAQYPVNTVTRLRADAWRNRAYTLDYTGDLYGALNAVSKARELYDSLPVADYDIARVELTRAIVLRHLGLLDDGLAAVRAAKPALAAAADSPRLRTARTIEAAMRLSAGDVRAALAIWLDLEAETRLDDGWTHAGILSNIAQCHCDLGDLGSALECYGRAVDAAMKVGATAEVQRFRWNVAAILVKEQRYEQAEAVFLDLIRRFTDLQMGDDAVLARLDLAEVLILQKRFDSVVEICDEVMEGLRRSGLEHTSRALTAVTYLQEATRAKRATAALARTVREFVRGAPRQPALLFAPPPI